MKFEETEKIEDWNRLCDKYGVGIIGGIRTSDKYPFIFVIRNPESNYEDSLKIDQNGEVIEINYLACKDDVENIHLKDHAYLNGVYYSVFLFCGSNGNYRCLGEYEVKKTYFNLDGRIESFDLQKVGKNGLDDEIVYFVEKDNPIELSKLTDRSDVIEGVYPEEENISYDGVDQDFHIQEGMYLDADFRPINLARIINTSELYQDGDSFSLHFVMREGSSMSERKVAHHLYLLNEANKKIQSMYLSSKEYVNPEEKIEEAFLYTVNVGCGLTNFLVKKTEKQTSVWAIDWGSGKNYTTEAKQHIESCLDDIKNTFFDGASFSLDKLFISHGDSDHFNRIDICMINADTEVWVSGYHYVAGRFLNKISQIILTGAKFKNPITTSSTSEIDVLHPVWPIVYGLPTFIGTGFYTAVKRNNVSPIIKINVNESSIIFPGDIMPYDDSHNTRPGGWAWFNTTRTGNLECDIYIHSHHGSVNGFITNIPGAGSCEYDTIISNAYILSTRDNAYTGIPSGAIMGRPEYSSIKSTQLAPNELIYYKTDLLAKTVIPII